MFTGESFCIIFIHRKYIAVDALSILDNPFNFCIVLFSFLVSVLFLAICSESQQDIPLYEVDL